MSWASLATVLINCIVLAVLMNSPQRKEKPILWAIVAGTILWSIVVMVEVSA